MSIALLPALAFQATTESEARHTRQQLVEDEALRLVRLVSAEQQRIVEGAEQALNAISGAPFVQDNLPEQCQRLLANLLEQSPRYIFAGVVGLDGHLVCAAGPSDSSVNFSDRAYFRNALQTDSFVIGEYTVGRVSGQPSIHFAKPLRNRDGIVVGVVELGLSLDWLRQQLEHLALPPDVAVSVRDRNGTILARFPDGARYVGQPMPDAMRFSLAGDEIKVVPMKTADGRARIVAYAPVDAEPKGLRIAVGLDRETAFAAVTQANRTGLFLIVAGAGLALVITVLGGRRLIRRPLDRLLAVADRWRTGDFAARTGLREDNSEFGRLAAAFDRMAVAQEAREQALRTALESTTDCVVVLDCAWRYTFLNERAKVRLAAGRDLLGQVMWDAVPRLAGTVFADAYRAAMERGVPTQVEGYYAPLKTHFEAQAYPSNDGLTIFYRDVTAERRTEQRFRAMFQQAAVGMSLAGLDRVPLSINEKLCDITGYTREELLVRSFRDITHPDDRAVDDAQTTALAAGEISTFTVEKRYLRKDGEVIWVNVTVSLLRAPDGSPECHIGVIEDITARKRTAEEFRQTAALLRAIGNCSPDPIYAKDTEGRFLFANPALLAVAGRPAEAVIGRTTAQWHHDAQQADAAMANDRRIIETGRMEITEEVFDAAGQGRRVFRSAKAPLRMEDGSIHGVAAVSSDITLIKETEARLRRLTGDLERRVREEVAARQRQDLLMAELDHRVKNMLATIQALVGQSRTSEDTLDGFLASFEGRLRAMSLAQSLLTKSRWEGANLQMMIAEEMAPYMGAAAPSVVIAADAPVLLRPKAALAFSLAVHELATNAAKYGALSVPGGRVVVDWHAEQRDGQVLVLHWCETGGPAVAEPTQRGFGLTLIETSLAYELGGTVQLCFPAAGLTCTVVVPWDQIASLAEPPAPPSAPARAGTTYLLAALGGKRVLVVEDNALLAANIVRNLKMVGVSVVGPVARLEAAVELAATAEIDIALLDVDLDGTPVWPAADRLLRRGIPFVLATGYEASLVVPRRFQDCPVLNKPFSVRELRGALLRPLEAARSGLDES